MSGSIMKWLLAIIISLLISINPCLIGRGLLRRGVQTAALPTQNETDQINKSLQEGFDRTKEIATFLLAGGKNVAESAQQAVMTGVGTMRDSLVSAKNQFDTSQKVLKSNMKSGLNWSAKLARKAVTTGIQRARDFSRTAKNRLTHLSYNLKNGVQTGAGHTKKIAAGMGSFLADQGKNIARLAGQAVGTGAEGARDFSVVAKNGLAHLMHNLKSGIQIGAGYTKEIAAGTGTFLVAQGKNIASLAGQAIGTGAGALKDSSVATKNCIGKMHTEWTPMIKAALSQTKEIAADTGSFLVAQGKNIASLTHQAASTIGDVSEYFTKSEKPVEERLVESPESLAQAKDVIADTSVLAQVQPTSQSIPIVHQGASSLEYHSGAQSYNAPQPIQIAMAPQPQAPMLMQTPAQQSSALAMQASAMAMQAQASAFMMQNQPLMIAAAPQVVQSVAPQVAQGPMYPYSPNVFTDTKGLSTQQKTNQFMQNIQQLSNTSEQDVNRLLMILDIEFDIMEQLLAGNTGQLVDELVYKRRESLKQSSPLIVRAYNLVIDLATTTGENSADPHLYHYFIRRGKRSKELNGANGKKKFLTNMMHRLEQYYQMIENMQRVVSSS